MSAVIKGGPKTGGLREEAKREKEIRILEAAQALFKEKGFEATTTKEISERAQIATGTLFLYAKNKNELLLWVYSQKIAKTIEKIRRARSATDKIPRSKADWMSEVSMFFEPFFRLYSDDCATARYFVKEQLFATGSRDSNERQLFLQQLEDYLERGKTAGFVRQEADNRAIAVALFAVYLLHVIAWLSAGGSFAPRLRELQAHLSQVLQGACAK